MNKWFTNSYALLFILNHNRLRQVDIKAEHFERKVQQLENDRDTYDRKVEELTEKYNGIKKELDDTLKSLDDM